jgi:hypothetical protein
VKEDGERTLIHCFAGCGAADVLEAIGLDFSALYPEERAHVKTNWRARSYVRKNMRADINCLLLLAEDVVKGKPVSKTDLDRVTFAARRLNRLAKVVQENGI